MIYTVYVCFVTLFVGFNDLYHSRVLYRSYRQCCKYPVI